MTKDFNANIPKGVLSRLARNEEGNVIAILAAAVLPVLGLVGGGIDISRLYLTQSKLQGACDSGALLGRKIMGMGNWNADDGIAGQQALQIFDQNFASGAYGTYSLTRSYSEANGNVTGTASATVPMALMQIFGQKEKVVTVLCKAELRIPNTDVMFVLDNTGSMDETPVNSNMTKIAGLRIAVKCFYEALAKQNINDVSPADCNETVNPTATNTGNVQLRFGFVPYAQNVNVGKLLPHSYMADQWTYQSREASMIDQNEPRFTYGTESEFLVSGQPVITNASNTAWTDTTGNVRQNGNTFHSKFKSSSSACLGRPSPATHAATGGGNVEYRYQTPAVPAYPDAQRTRHYERISREYRRAYQYDYRADSDPEKNGDCVLQFRDFDQKIKTEPLIKTTPINWSTDPVFAGWTYKPVTFDVSVLKSTSGSGWNNSITIPIGTGGTNRIIGWTGCIEERETYRGTDNDPSNDWDPIPADALDMNIDLAPTSDIKTKWAPQLFNAVYLRRVLNPDGTPSETPTQAEIFTPSSNTASMPIPLASVRRNRVNFKIGPRPISAIT